MNLSCNRNRIGFVWLAACLLALPVSAQEKPAHWPQFRGPGGMGVSTEKNLPVTWNQRENIAWKTDLPGPGSSSPVIFGDRIFLTCYTGYNVPGQDAGSQENLKLHVLCIDRATGKILWNKTFAPELPEQARIRENHGYASNTPAVDDKRVYAFFGKSGVIALDHDGKELWRTSVGTGLNGWGSAASPTLVGDLVIINASVESQSLVALNRTTGKEAWRAPGIKEAWNTPILVEVPGGAPELVVPIMRSILAFDPRTGQSLWSCDTGINWYMVPSVVAKDGVIYCIGGRSGGALAVKAGGRGNVTATHRVWTGTKGSNVPSPVYHDGHVYWASDTQPMVYCADARTGKIVYEQPIPRLSQIYAPALLADGKIYFTTRNGQTLVVAAAPKFEQLALNDLKDGGVFNAGPAVAAGRIYIRSDKALYCIGK